MILLDTHAWIWWVTESVRLSAEATQAIAQADRLGVTKDQKIHDWQQIKVIW